MKTKEAQAIQMAQGCEGGIPASVLAEFMGAQNFDKNGRVVRDLSE